MKELIFYKHINGKEPVKTWLEELDVGMRLRILSRLTRVENGNYGDFKKIDDVISELRFNFGSGYRIYFTEIDDVLILLLCAGDKKMQSKDIAQAKEYLQIWRTNNGL